MPPGLGRATISHWIDDYIEEVAVGTSWWVLVGGFGLGMPLLAGLAGLAFRLRYAPGTYGIALFVGLAVGFGLVLIARERVRYRAQAFDRSGDLAALRKLTWRDFEIVVGEALRRDGYPIVKERGGFIPDDGIDLIVEGYRKRIAIQCKHWRAWTISAPRVREQRELICHVQTTRWLTRDSERSASLAHRGLEASRCKVERSDRRMS